MKFGRPLSAIVAAIGLIAAPIATYAHTGHLPLGDGKISSAPRKGYIFACQSRFPGGGGAFRAGSWMRDGYWAPDEKPTVEGNVAWPDARISIGIEGNQRVVRANNLPLHRTGQFPVRPGSKAYAYDRNPNHIGGQNILLRMPITPAQLAQPRCVPMGMIGFATSGVALFNAFDLDGRDAPAYEIQDKCNGHPELTSQYHYHNWSPCLAATNPNAPVGWIIDGYPILGPVDAKGHEVTNAELDECHGMTGPVMIDGKTVVTYHYRFTYEYPYTVGCFRGAPIYVPRPRPPMMPPPPFR